MQPFFALQSGESDIPDDGSQLQVVTAKPFTIILLGRPPEIWFMERESAVDF